MVEWRKLTTGVLAASATVIMGMAPMFSYALPAYPERDDVPVNVMQENEFQEQQVTGNITITDERVDRFGVGETCINVDEESCQNENMFRVGIYVSVETAVPISGDGGLNSLLYAFDYDGETYEGEATEFQEWAPSESYDGGRYTSNWVASFELEKINSTSSGNEGDGSSTASVQTEQQTARADEQTARADDGYVHIHRCEWVITEQPTIDRLGSMEYRCSCGFIGDTAVVDNTMVYADRLLYALDNLPASGTVKLDLGEFYSLSPAMLKKIMERTDLSYEITYIHMKVKYVATVPAGFDWEGVCVEKDKWVGLPFIASFPTVEQVVITR